MRCLSQWGFAHGFAALSDATVMYVTTSEYDPEIERELNPCDPALAIEWGCGGADYVGQGCRRRLACRRPVARRAAHL